MLFVGSVVAMADDVEGISSESSVLSSEASSFDVVEGETSSSSGPFDLDDVSSSLSSEASDNVSSSSFSEASDAVSSSSSSSDLISSDGYLDTMSIPLESCLLIVIFELGVIICTRFMRR